MPQPQFHQQMPQPLYLQQMPPQFYQQMPQSQYPQQMPQLQMQQPQNQNSDLLLFENFKKIYNSKGGFKQKMIDCTKLQITNVPSSSIINRIFFSFKKYNNELAMDETFTFYNELWEIEQNATNFNIHMVVFEGWKYKNHLHHLNINTFRIYYKKLHCDSFLHHLASEGLIDNYRLLERWQRIKEKLHEKGIDTTDTILKNIDKIKKVLNDFKKDRLRKLKKWKDKKNADSETQKIEKEKGEEEDNQRQIPNSTHNNDKFSKNQSIKNSKKSNSKKVLNYKKGNKKNDIILKAEMKMMQYKKKLEKWKKILKQTKDSKIEFSSDSETEFSSDSETEFSSDSETKFSSDSETKFSSDSETEFSSDSETEY